jgi:hypothetical protein
MTYLAPVLFSEVEDCIITQAKGKVKRESKASSKHEGPEKKIHPTLEKKNPAI